MFDVRGGTALVQQRHFVREKYSKLTLAYYLIARRGKGVTVTDVAETPAKKAALRKMASTNPAPGTLIDWAQGKAQARTPKKPRTVYKAWRVMRLDEDGTLRSVFDHSQWTLGKARSEKARHNHMGGYFWYNSEKAVREVALERNGLLRRAHENGRNLVVVECEAWGTVIEYPDVEYPEPSWESFYREGSPRAVHYPTKFCSTFLRPLRIVGPLVEPVAEMAA
jgi:hypothetical protein